MKINELMIGDWLLREAPSGTIVPIRMTVKEFVGMETILINSKYTWNPIKLTDEILEKNGFTRTGGRSTHESHNFLILHWSEDNLIFNSVSKDEHPIHIPNLQYVHELQHAMRLTGFGEFADNFKL